MTLRQMIKLVRRRFAEQMCGKGAWRGTAALGAKMPSSQSPDVQQGRKANNKFLDCIPIHGSHSCSLLIVTELISSLPNLHGAQGRAAICGKVQKRADLEVHTKNVDTNKQMIGCLVHWVLELLYFQCKLLTCMLKFLKLTYVF